MPGRDAFLIGAGVDWTQVIVAVVAAVPATFSALLGYRVLTHLRTPSGTKIGTQVEDAVHTSLANHYRLIALEKKLGGEKDEAA